VAWPPNLDRVQPATERRRPPSPASVAWPRKLDRAQSGGEWATGRWCARSRAPSGATGGCPREVARRVAPRIGREWTNEDQRRASVVQRRPMAERRRADQHRQRSEAGISAAWYDMKLDVLSFVNSKSGPHAKTVTRADGLMPKSSDRQKPQNGLGATVTARRMADVRRGVGPSAAVTVRPGAEAAGWSRWLRRRQRCRLPCAPCCGPPP
jgi:hypothetical protein